MRHLFWVQVLVFSVLSISGLQAADLEHLGHPPKGKIFVELRSEAAVAPLQLLGSVDPPTLLLNGKKLTRKPYQGPYSRYPGPGPAIWVNGVRRPTTGDIGRFFIALKGAAAAVPKLTVVMKTRKGDISIATANINRSFLDAPFKVSVELGIDEEVDKDHEFTLGGAIPKGASLEINDGSVSQPGKTNAEVTIKRGLGRSVIAGRLVGEDGTVRVLNIPVRITKLQFQPGKPVLSIEAPSGNHIYQDWVVPYWGFAVQGVTNPEAKLEVAGKEVKVEKNGEFWFYMTPEKDPYIDVFKAKHPKLPMKVSLPNGRSRTFTKRMLCQNCEVKSRLWAPKFRHKYDWYFGGSVTSFAWVAPRDGKIESEFDEYFESSISAKTQPTSPIIGVRAGYYWKHNFNFELGFKRYVLTMSGTSRNRILRAEGLMVGTLDLNWSPTPVFSVGGGLAVLKANMESDHFLSPPDGNNLVIGAGFNFQLRFPLDTVLPIFKNIEYTPKLTVIPAQAQLTSTKAKWHLISFEPIALRYYP